MTDAQEGGAYFDSVSVVYTIQDSVVADGYGTVITPKGTFGNALKITHYILTTKSFPTKSNGSWETPFVVATYDTTYQWWVPGEIYPVMEILQMSASSSGDNQSQPVYYAVYNEQLITTGIEKPIEAEVAAAYPNPSNGSFFLREADKVVSITDISGAAVDYHSFSFGNNSLKLDLQEKNPGIYFVRFIRNGETRLARVSITE